MGRETASELAGNRARGVREGARQGRHRRGRAQPVMLALLVDALAGYGLLSLLATGLLVLILCTDWQQWRRRKHLRIAAKCRWCGYAGPLEKVTEHEALDHAGSGQCLSGFSATTRNGSRLSTISTSVSAPAAALACMGITGRTCTATSMRQPIGCWR